ncbi:MAG TPA: inorganic diphosphatase [Caldimonas sp.]|nr:inorganic diphosphatase [Caldimonas sp.]
MPATRDPPTLESLPATDAEGLCLAVIEASRGTRNKMKYRAEWRAFTLAHALPQGMVFPYDFGFIPSTLGEDGDPLDVLVLADEPLPMGTVVSCRLIGVIEAEQQEERRRAERNDRLIAVADASHRHRHVRALRDMSPDLLQEIESFFMDDNRLRGRRFMVLGRHGPSAARGLVKEGERRRREREAGERGSRPVNGDPQRGPDNARRRSA